jgi:signal transduction histidine kinase
MTGSPAVRGRPARGAVLDATPRDVVVAAVAFALTLTLLAFDHNAQRGLDALGLALAAVACFPLIAHRRTPLAVFAVTTVASATLNGLGYAAGPPFGPTIAIFYVAADDRSRARWRETAATVLGLFAVHVLATAGAHPGFPTSAVLFGVVIWGGAWMIGDQVRQRRRRRDEAAERLRRSERDVERERRLAAAEERTRIARDLHDSAAHAINVILVQAGAARLLQQRDPEAARVALSTIEDVARDTIGEIDVLVRGLRDPRAVESPAGVEPPTGLSALGTLAERVEAGGLELDVRLQGTARTLSRGVDQAAYRILQESLTNATRHGTGSAEVEIRYGSEAIELTVRNQVAGAVVPDTGGSHGILGMRERAALLGGSLDAGLRDGEFVVVARLPYGGEERQ